MLKNKELWLYRSIVNILVFLNLIFYKKVVRYVYIVYIGRKLYGKVKSKKNVW